ncbi:Gfo/Idh/MocA family protein [Parapedobacter deserti]|uniref:Gfo/Idh/MocA family protein n=1 Tax=Parapedobacter deserti TaxID=1912957 RepID=A0ABV7JHT8_9SPHI
MNSNATHTNRRTFVKQAAALAGISILPRHVLGGRGYHAPSDQVTLGFIGGGRQALSLQRSFAKTGRAKIVACAEVYRAKLAHFVAQLDSYAGQTAASCRSLIDFRELLAMEGVDAVVIATPDHWHGVMAVAAARARKGIYCEKPLALTVGEGRAIVDAAARYDVAFQTGSMQRSAQEFRQAVNLVRNGVLGHIQRVTVNIGGPPKPYDLPKEPIPAGLDWSFWLGPNEPVHFNHELAPVTGDPLWARWRYYEGLGGGDMTDWGAHMFDIAQWALDMDGSGPVSVEPQVIDGKPQLMYRYASGVTMVQRDHEPGRHVVFGGTEGSLRVQRRKLETNPSGLASTVLRENAERVYHSDNHYVDFLNAVVHRSPTICPPETGHRTNTVCVLGNIAYRLNRALIWDPTRERFADDPMADALLTRGWQNGWV